MNLNAWALHILQMASQGAGRDNIGSVVGLLTGSFFGGGGP